MSNGNTNVVSRVMGQVGTLRQYAVSVIVGINVNPFTWHIAGDCGAKKEDGVREVYFTWLPLTVLLGVYRRPAK